MDRKIDRLIDWLIDWLIDSVEIWGLEVSYNSNYKYIYNPTHY